MEHIDKVLVALDKTDMDRNLVRYGHAIAGTLKAKEVHFVHVEPENEGTHVELLDEFDVETLETGDFEQWVKQLLKEETDDNPAYQVKWHHLHGSPVRELLKFLKEQDIDLVVLGTKNKKNGSGLVPHRVARKAPCSILFVPEEVDTQLERMIIPTDFSEYSSMAFKEARYFRKRFPEMEIQVHHVYRVPTGYYKTGKSYEEFAEIMRENAEKAMDKFIADYNLHDLKLVPIYTLDDDANPADKLVLVAKEEKVDLMIICAKGHTRASSLLLGSTTEKVLQLDHTIPFLVLKEKGETLNFLQILLNI